MEQKELTDAEKSRALTLIKLGTSEFRVTTGMKVSRQVEFN